MSLSELHKRFEAWKPIHLCWWFEKHGWKVPRYLIGTTITLDQRNFIMADDDPSGANDPDSCTFDTENADRTSQARSEAFHIRIQVASDGPADAGNYNFSLWYDTDNTPSTATQVTTASAVIQLVNSTGGSALADADACDTIKCTAQAETWQDGSYLETSDETGKIDLDSGFYTELQFCLQLLPAASGTYYFFARGEGIAFTGTHDEVPAVTAAVADLSIPDEVETVTVTDVDTVDLIDADEYDASEVDTVGVTDVDTVSVQAASDIEPDEGEDITVTDVDTVDLIEADEYDINESESVTVTDVDTVSTSAVADFDVDEFEAISVADEDTVDVEAAPGGDLSADEFEAIGVTDVISITNVLTVKI